MDIDVEKRKSRHKYRDRNRNSRDKRYGLRYARTMCFVIKRLATPYKFKRTMVLRRLSSAATATRTGRLAPCSCASSMVSRSTKNRHFLFHVSTTTHVSCPATIVALPGNRTRFSSTHSPPALEPREDDPEVAVYQADGTRRAAFSADDTEEARQCNDPTGGNG